LCNYFKDIIFPLCRENFLARNVSEILKIKLPKPLSGNLKSGAGEPFFKGAKHFAKSAEQFHIPARQLTSQA
jgi:hypothetical protein